MSLRTTSAFGNAFASEAYGEDSYISYLVDRLIQNYIMDYNFANKPLRFETPLFRSLLERCQKIGTDLYLYEPRAKGDLALFEDLHGMARSGVSRPFAYDK